MPGRLDQIEGMLKTNLGSALLAACPDLVYTVSGILYRFLRKPDSLPALWVQVDSALFNTVFQATGGKMRVTLDDGRSILATGEMLRDLADRLLALAYRRMDVSPTLTDALYDLSRAGSYAAMRELVSRFPMDAIYALHNWPGMPLGQVAIGSGAMMASLDAFEITLTGKSCHAAMPERGADPIVAAAQLIMALQTIPSRRLSPQESTVVSITQISGGEAINVLPDKVVLRGTFRCLNNQVRERVRGLIESYVAAQPQVSDVEGKIAWYPGYPVTTNHPAEAQKVREVATALLGESAVSWNGNPSMASEDFACMLEACPGAYFWIGTDGETASKPLHNAGYDFNDELIPHGVALWTALVEKLLA